MKKYTFLILCALFTLSRPMAHVTAESATQSSDPGCKTLFMLDYNQLVAGFGH